MIKITKEDVKGDYFFSKLEAEKDKLEAKTKGCEIVDYDMYKQYKKKEKLQDINNFLVWFSLGIVVSILCLFQGVI